jgi:hypothetical protein
MTFDFLPLRIPRWQRVLLIAAIVLGGVRACYSFWSGITWDGFFSAAMTFAAVCGLWALRRNAGVHLQLDSAGICLSKVASSTTPISWRSIEKVEEGLGSLSIYYKDGIEPRLLQLEGSNFQREDWEQIRELILNSSQAEHAAPSDGDKPLN